MKYSMYLIHHGFTPLNLNRVLQKVQSTSMYCSMMTDANPYLAGIAYGGNSLPNLHQQVSIANASNASDGTGAEFSRGLFPASETNCWGTVTSQADTNPHVLIKEIEVKRSKKVSYDG